MTAALPVDPIALASALIRRPSVTPEDAGALKVLTAPLEAAGFTCHRLPFEADGTPTIENLYARAGDDGPCFLFAGHTDVVPPGPLESWSVDPFGGTIIDGKLYGRGAADMKGAIAAFVAAATGFRRDHPRRPGAIALLITGDEEGPAINGTVKVLEWMKARGERIDACVVGEPTNPRRLGEMAKIGRRGSLTGYLTVTGVQGHAAYPHLADNPIPKLVSLLTALGHGELDAGTEHFQPSNLQVTTIDVGNPAANVIPGVVYATFNARFNDGFTAASLEAMLRARLDSAGPAYELTTHVAGEAFLTPPGALSDLVQEACADVLGSLPELSTTGGTSDARFIRRHCPVVEFGLAGQTMHKIDEHVPVADITALAAIYRRMLDRFFGVA